MMPRHIFFAFMIQAVLMGMSTILLVQPKGIFATQRRRARVLATWTGVVFFCLMFCWAVILGSVLALNRMVIEP